MTKQKKAELFGKRPVKEAGGIKHLHRGYYKKLQKILIAYFESTAGNPYHNGRVCSTWGNFHFKTFDGDIFYFPGVCNYIFASNCKSSYEDFNIQIRRAIVENATVITHVIMKLEGVVIELTPSSVLLDNKLYVPTWFPVGSLSKCPFPSFHHCSQGVGGLRSFLR